MPRTSYRWSCPACKARRISRSNLKSCRDCGFKGWWDQVGRALPFHTRVLRCRTCRAKFEELMDAAGAPPQYCPGCRKDFLLYPGAMRRMRREIKAGRNPERAIRDAKERVIEQTMGTSDENR